MFALHIMGRLSGTWFGVQKIEYGAIKHLLSRAIYTRTTRVLQY